MTCPGGCVAGGGQRIGVDNIIEARTKSLYDIDDRETIKVSQKSQLSSFVTILTLSHKAMNHILVT